MLWFLSFFKRCVFLEYISKIFFKKGLENVPPLWNKIISNFMTIVIWITVIFIIKKSPIVIPNFKMIMLIAITSSLYQIFLYALSKGKVALRWNRCINLLCSNGYPGNEIFKKN